MTKENIYELLPPDKKKDLSACIGECAVETGRNIGADFVVAGEIVRFAGEIRVSFSLHDTHEGNLLAF